MRILISYFFGNNTIPLGKSCARELENLGCKVFSFNSGINCPVDTLCLKPVNKIIWNLGYKNIDVSKKSKWNNQAYRQRLLEKAVRQFKPNNLLIIRGHGFDGNFLKSLKKKYNIDRLVGWWVKGPQWADLMKKESLFYDFYFCIHKEHNIEKVKFLSAIGTDKHIFKKINLTNNSLIISHKIVFVGGWSLKRQNILTDISDLPLSIWGPTWKKKNLWKKLSKNIKGSRIFDLPLVKLYNTAKIVLNISNWSPNKSGLNLRVFDVPACGAFLLTEYSEELKEYFNLGIEIETFKDNLELRDKLSYYLKYDKKRKEIAQKGYEKVTNFFSYKNKMFQYLQNINYNRRIY